MGIDAQAQQLLDGLAAVEAPPLSEQTPADVRLSGQLLGQLSIPEEVGSVDDRTVAGPAGPIPVRVYTPVDAPAGAPALVWYHGGGFVIGDLDSADGVCRSLCRRAGVVVVSVDYRLAPEHQFPAAADDALAAFDAVWSAAASFGIDGDRIAVGGDSAGGNLAAVVSNQRRGVVAFQLLVYPVTDLGHADSTSYRDNAEGYLLTAELMNWFESNYIGDAPINDPRASPRHEPDLSGVAPAFVMTAEFDPLRDEGEAYGERLRAAGVAVDIKRYDGMIHAFIQMSAVIDATNGALDDAAAALRGALA